MYYIWKRIGGGSTHFFQCKLERFDGVRNFVRRKKIKNVPEEGLIYNTTIIDLEPEDFPRTGTIFNFLVSKKLADIIKQFNLDIDFIPSKIIRRNGVEIDDYYTLSITDIIDCVDFKESDVEIDNSDPDFIEYNFAKLVIDETKLKEHNKIFWLGEKSTWLIVHQDIVDCIDKAEVSGVKFIPVNECNKK